MTIISGAITSNLRHRDPPTGPTAWPNVDTWSLDTIPIEFNAATTDMVGCVWNDDGTRIYVTGDTGANSTLYHNSPDYTVPYVPEDDTSPTSTNFNRGSARAREIAWNGDGTALFTVNYSGNDVTKHANTGTAYNPTTDDITATPSQTFSFSGILSLPRSIDISPDGTIMWVVSNATGRDIYEITMSTPFDLTTAAGGSEYEPTEGDMICMKFSPDGYKYYAMGLDRVLYEYTVSTQWDISTSSYTGRSLDVTNSRTPICFDVSPDATKMIVGFFDTASADTEFAHYTA